MCLRRIRLVLIAVSFAAANAWSIDLPQHTYLVAYADSAATASTTESPELFAVPTTNDRAGRIVAPVMVNGQGPFRFIVDTGANRSVITPKLAQRLGLPVRLDKPIQLSGVTGRVLVGTTLVSRLEAGALVLTDVDLPVVASALADVDGILGVEAFGDMRLVVDFANNQFKIERSDGRRPPRGFATLPAQFKHGRLLVIDAAIGEQSAKAVIDTGAEGTLGTPSLRALLHRRTTRDHVGGAMIEGVGTDVQRAQVINAPAIHLANVEIKGAQISYGDFHIFEKWGLQDRPALLIGMDVLGAVDVLVIDYKRREVQIKPRCASIKLVQRRVASGRIKKWMHDDRASIDVESLGGSGCQLQHGNNRLAGLHRLE